MKLQWEFKKEKITELRNELGLTVEQCATILGMKKQQLNQYEKGIRTPSVRNIIRMMNTFGRPSTYFFVQKIYQVDKQGV